MQYGIKFNLSNSYWNKRSIICLHQGITRYIIETKPWAFNVIQQILILLKNKRFINIMDIGIPTKKTEDASGRRKKAYQCSDFVLLACREKS